MWQILVDHARKRRAHKRGRPARAAQPAATLADPTGGLEMDVLALPEALDETLSNHKLDARIRAAGRWLHDVHGDGGGPCSSSAICIATSREQYAVPRVTALVNRLWTHD